MGKLSKIKHVSTDLYNRHIGNLFPYSEEDEEGIVVYESPRKCRMKFKGISVKEGYDKTVKMYKKIHLLNHIYISIDGEFVVVQF